MNEHNFFTKTTKTVITKEFNIELIEKTVRAYLASNEIAGEKYKLERVIAGNNSKNIEVRLVRNNHTPDEDFSHDDGWAVFCNKMEELLEVNSFDVPYYYYPK